MLFQDTDHVRVRRGRDEHLAADKQRERLQEQVEARAHREAGEPVVFGRTDPGGASLQPRRRPHRSERTPATGVSRMPGSVKTVISNPTCPDETPNASRISGNAGVTLEVPSTAISVTPKMTCRLWSL
ncbi:MAG: hypothetical protein M3N45_07955 [Actinomycetota bacterium]|nr:hypothetical protein [Actinomycetota bacterium]